MFLTVNNMITYTLKVTGLYYESSDAVTISFKQPALKKVKFKPGQYLTVIVNINNRKYKRPYSLSSAPLDNILSITVKRLTHGVVSNHLIDIVKEGDLLEVIEPMGDFVYNPDIHDTQEVFLWGAGSGITPLMSILKTALSGGKQKISLFYGNKSLNQTIFYNQLIQLKEQYPSTLTIFLFFTEELVAGTKQGRISAEDVYEGLKYVTDIDNTIHYICGPSELKEVLKTALTERGLKQNQVFSEDFEHRVNEAEIKDIQTQFVEIINKQKLLYA